MFEEAKSHALEFMSDRLSRTFKRYHAKCNRAKFIFDLMRNIQ